MDGGRDGAVGIQSSKRGRRFGLRRYGSRAAWLGLECNGSSLLCAIRGLEFSASTQEGGGHLIPFSFFHDVTLTGLPCMQLVMP